MPIYEYQCQDCGHCLEVLQSISEAPLKQCPQCGANSLHKIVSAAGFRLAGSGWYETDFKSGNQRNLAGDGKATTKDSAQDKTKDGAGDTNKKSASPKTSATKESSA